MCGRWVIRVSDLAKDRISESVSKIYLNFNKAKKYSDYIIKFDDIVITTVGSKAELKESAVGRAIIFRRNDKYLLNQNLVKISPKENNDNQFIYTQLLTARYTNYIKDIQRGNANQANIAINDLWEYSLQIPIFKEQTKIGNFFQQIDHLISQHQQKHDKLLNIKKALLEKMFPQPGKTQPEIRFKGFSGEWKEEILGNVTDVRDGTHDSPKYYSSGYPFITSKNVKDGYINYDEVQYISKEDFDKINKRSKVDINDILMGMIGTIGNIALIREITEFAIKNVALIKDIKLANYLYIYIFLQSPLTLNQLNSEIDGGTQKFISLNKVRNLKIYLPQDRIEQAKIGNFFQQLDRLINQHQTQIQKLNHLKQAFLSKMFV